MRIIAECHLAPNPRLFADRRRRDRGRHVHRLGVVTKHQATHELPTLQNSFDFVG
jgi:hypothetical protein